jgi:hypothetical protein
MTSLSASSHTLRVRQAVAAAAMAHGLTVQELPPIGSVVSGETIHDASPSNLAVSPLADALARVPERSLSEARLSFGWNTVRVDPEEVYG